VGQFKDTLMRPNLHHGVSEGSSLCHVFGQDGLDDDGVGVDDGDVLVRPGPLVFVDLYIQIIKQRQIVVFTFGFVHQIPDRILPIVKSDQIAIHLYLLAIHWQ
jgi:hypothetical protein